MLSPQGFLVVGREPRVAKSGSQAGSAEKEVNFQPAAFAVPLAIRLDFRQMLVQLGGIQFGQKPQFLHGQETRSGRRTVVVDRPAVEFHAGIPDAVLHLVRRDGVRGDSPEFPQLRQGREDLGVGRQLKADSLLVDDLLQQFIRTQYPVDLVRVGTDQHQIGLNDQIDSRSPDLRSFAGQSAARPARRGVAPPDARSTPRGGACASSPP